MLPLCDVVSLHAPANEDCRHMLNARNLPTLKDGCLLINTARGPVVDSKALAAALRRVTKEDVRQAAAAVTPDTVCTLEEDA